MNKDQDSGPATTAGDGPTLPLIENAFLRWDGACLRVLSKQSPEELDRGIASIATTVENGLETPSLKALCAARCEKASLLWLLHPFSPTPVFELLGGIFYTPGPLSARALFKRNPEAVKKLLKRLEKIADEIELLNVSFEYGWMLPESGPELRRFWDLPETIRDYVKLMTDLRKHFGGGAEGVHNLAKARLTAYVKHTTGHFHDKEVAALVGAVMGKDYAETDHRSWRKRHYNRLEKLFIPSASAPDSLP